MNHLWKGILLFLVLITVIIYDLPSLFTFLNDNEKVSQILVEKRFQKINLIYQELKGLKEAVSEHKEHRILILMENQKKFPIHNPVIQEILGENNFTLQENADQTYLIETANHNKDLFISDVADDLNYLFKNLKKIKSIQIADDHLTIFFNMEKIKRLSNLSEPIKTMIGEDFDWIYNANKHQYLSSPKSSHNVIQLGLDLQGGMYLDLGVKTETVIDAIINRFNEEFEAALIKNNVNYQSIKKVTPNTVMLTLEANEVIDLENKHYKRLLQFYDVQNDGNQILFKLQDEEEQRVKKQALDQALETIRNRIDLLGVKEPSIQRRGENSIIIQLPGLKDPARARKVIGTSAVLEFKLLAKNGDIEHPTDNQEILLQENFDPLTKELLSTTPYLIEKKTLLTGDTIRDARISISQMTNEIYVSLSFDDKGKEIFGQITSDNTGRRLAIILDNKIQSAPNINEPILGGEAQISGNFSISEAKDLALILRSGSLPAPIIINEERTVGASLGKDSIQESMYALIIGFISVILFMIIYYRISGVFSDCALIFNLFIIIAILAYFQATLTLPGIAGIILTIGMAVDANVLIFERIREEIAKGSGLRKSIQMGFQKATITILDSNITTIIAAIVLFQFGTGPIKGFAVTLSIGVAASMFTSIVVTRYLFEIFYLNSKNLTKISI